VQGARPRGRPKKTWTEIVEKDCQARKLNREDGMDRNRWRKKTTIGVSGWMFCLVAAHSGCPGQNSESRKNGCACCIYHVY